jgi:serine/threonine protein kinase
MSRPPPPPPDGHAAGGAGGKANAHVELPGSHTLPPGHRVDEFEVLGCVGEGGFGIVYLAFDHLLQRRVALKEFMPSSIALRMPGGSAVRVKAPRHQETFEAGLRSFVNEARRPHAQARARRARRAAR